jgi:hypothetical protein
MERAIDKLVAAGLAERVVIDGEPGIRLTRAGFAAAERLRLMRAEAGHA